MYALLSLAVSIGMLATVVGIFLFGLGVGKRYAKRLVFGGISVGCLLPAVVSSADELIAAYTTELTILGGLVLALALLVAFSRFQGATAKLSRLLPDPPKTSQKKRLDE